MDCMPEARFGGNRPKRDKARRLAQEGDQKFKNNRTKEAQTLYESALGADPDCPEALAAYGYFLLRMGRAEEAERTYRKALEVSPDFTDAQVKLGLLHMYRQQTPEAANMLEKAAAGQPQSGNVQVHLADAYWVLELRARSRVPDVARVVLRSRGFMRGADDRGSDPMNGAASSFSALAAPRSASLYVSGQRAERATAIAASSLDYDLPQHRYPAYRGAFEVQSVSSPECIFLRGRSSSEGSPAPRLRIRKEIPHDTGP
jgi:tetratricopeptide (TPR) repeat protein